MTFGGLLLVVAVTLLLLEAALGLRPSGWAVGLVCGAVAGSCVVRGLVRCSHVPGAPDAVTLARLGLACGVAALVADSFGGRQHTGAVVGLAAAALVLDAVDGWVARRTQSSSRFGALLDGEADAFLMLVLSVYVARSVGAWVLGFGAARYVFGAAGWALPWMRDRLPFRYWRKVVTATEGVVLTTVAAELLPRSVEYVALLVALALLAESFGRDVVWLWLRRDAAAAPVSGALGLPISAGMGAEGPVP